MEACLPFQMVMCACLASQLSIAEFHALFLGARRVGAWGNELRVRPVRRRLSRISMCITGTWQRARSVNTPRMYRGFGLVCCGLLVALPVLSLARLRPALRVSQSLRHLIKKRDKRIGIRDRCPMRKPVACDPR